MDDLIKRSDAVKDFGRIFGDLGVTLFGIGGNELAQTIANAIPSAERKGEWIFVEEFMGFNRYKCSVCEREELLTYLKNFCSNCGARMKGADDDNA